MKKSFFNITKVFAMLLCVAAFAACSSPDIPKLLEQGKTAFYKANYSEARKAFKTCADEGDSQGQFWLAYTTSYTQGHYSDTDTLSMSKEEMDKYVYDLFKKSADQNDGDGYYGLVSCYMNGIGVKKDNKKWIEYLDKSVELGSAWGKANKGLLLIQQGGKENIKKGIELIKESAESGNYYGKYSLGACYIDGKGVETDIDKGMGLLRESAKHGIRSAYTSLAQIYYFGTVKGIKENHAEAFKYAEQGANSAITYYILSQCYYNGEGTAKNESRAAFHAKQSALLGFVPGETWWAAFCASGYGTQEEAFNWYKKAADQGDILAMAQVGKYALMGTAGKTDYAMAKRYLQKAASMGSTEASELLSTYSYLLSGY